MFGPSGPIPSPERRARFEQDRAALARIHPDMHHYIQDTGNARAEGIMHVDAGAGCVEDVAIRIDFGSHYPDVPPVVYDASGRWNPNPDRHIMGDGEFCLWLDRVDAPDVSTVEGLDNFLLRLLPFLRDQLVFDDIGRWPGKDWPHGWRAAYAQHIIERLHVNTPKAFQGLWPAVLGAEPRPDRACPCGSRLPYGRCHRADVGALCWIRGLSGRDDVRASVEDRLRDAA